MNRRQRNIDLGPAGTARQHLDRMAVPVPGGEVHHREQSVGTEGIVDQARALHEGGPVEPREQPHARDHVANGDVHLRLALVLATDGLLGRRPVRGEMLLEPPQGRGRGRILVTQPLEELHEGGVREPGIRELRHDTRRVARSAGAEAQQAVRQAIGHVAGDATPDDPLGRAPEVLDEDDPQADRDRPQLADRQGLDPLVGDHHPAQGLRVEAAVRVRDVGPGQAKDARVAREGAIGELGELPVVGVGKVVPDLAELLLDDVEVVDEPFRRRRDRPLFPDRDREGSVRLEQEAPVVREPGKDRPAPAGLVRDGLGRGQRFGVLLQALGAEQLRDNRLFGITERVGRLAERPSSHHLPVPTTVGRIARTPQCVAGSRRIAVSVFMAR